SADGTGVTPGRVGRRHIIQNPAHKAGFFAFYTFGFFKWFNPTPLNLFFLFYDINHIPYLHPSDLSRFPKYRFGNKFWLWS
ncbi:hypothetical protein D0X99_19895, partial [Algoriphagus lacus]